MMTKREEFEAKLNQIDALFGKQRDLVYDEKTDTYQCVSINTAYAWFKFGQQTTKAHAVPKSALPALLWILANHQGGKSDIGQPIRELLGIGQHDDLTKEQFDTAMQFGKQINKPRVPAFELPDRMHHELEGDRVSDSHGNAYADGYNQCLSEVITLLEEAESKPVVPDGWKLVPIEPTKEMLQAADDHLDGCCMQVGAWMDMLEAAPEVLY